MLKIGDLSKITNISVKTIRFYEQQNLLHPVEVDRWTGYRYYDETSIKKLSEVVYLKKLGFSLKEIKSFNEDSIKEKTKELNLKIDQLKQNVLNLSEIKKEGEEYIMKSFINDPNVIGKWKRIAVVKEKEDFIKCKFDDEDIFDYKEIYFLPNGEDYWVFSWSKNTLHLNGKKLPYEIIDGKLYIGVVDFKTNTIENYAIYEQVDNKEYKKSEIQIKDNTNIPFVNDQNVIGYWETVDYVRNFEDFIPNKKFWSDELFLLSYTFNPNGSLIAEFKTDIIIKINWSKGVVINQNISTVSEYNIKEINGNKYMFVEWKSGDYVYGGEVYGYYVLRQNKI